MLQFYLAAPVSGDTSTYKHAVWWQLCREKTTKIYNTFQSKLNDGIEINYDILFMDCWKSKLKKLNRTWKLHVFSSSSCIFAQIAGERDNEDKCLVLNVHACIKLVYTDSIQMYTDFSPLLDRCIYLYFVMFLEIPSVLFQNMPCFLFLTSWILISNWDSVSWMWFTQCKHSLV